MFQRNNNNYQRKSYNNSGGNYRSFRSNTNYNRRENTSHDHSLCAYEHEHSFFKEFFCHFPIALVSLCFSVIFAFLYESFFISNSELLKITYSRLFHTTHYIHILFATMGGLMMFLRFAPGRYIFGTIVSMISAMLFCTISDIILPSITSPIFGEKIGIHICFFDFTDAMNILIFSFLGILGALCINFGDRKQNITTSKWLHGSHVWMSCLASLFYLFSNISYLNIDNLGFLVLAMTISIVFPCVISDTIIPVFFGKFLLKKHNIYDEKKI